MATVIYVKPARSGFQAFREAFEPAFARQQQIEAQRAAQDRQVEIQRTAREETAAGKAEVLEKKTDEELAAHTKDTKEEIARLTSSMLDIPEHERQARYYTEDGKRLSPAGITYAKSGGEQVVLKRANTDELLEGARLSADEKSARMLEAVPIVRELAQLPTHTTEQAAKFKQASLDVQRGASIESRQRAILDNDTSIMGRILSGQQPLPKEDEAKIAEIRTLYQAGKHKDADVKAGELLPIYPEIAKELIMLGADSRKEARAQRAEGRADVSTDEAKLRFEAWQKDRVAGKPDIYVNPETGLPISDKLLTFGDAVTQGDIPFPVSRSVYEARRDMTIWVKDTWDLVTLLKPGEVKYIEKGALDPSHPQHGETKGYNPIAVARVQATRQAELKAPKTLSEATQARNLLVDDFKTEYNIKGDLSARQQTYVNLLAPSVMSLPKSPNVARGQTMGFYVAERLNTKAMKNFIIHFADEDEALVTLKTRTLDASALAGEMILAARGNTGQKQLPGVTKFQAAVMAEMNDVVSQFLQEKLPSAAIESMEGYLDEAGFSKEAVADRVFTRLTGEPAPLRPRKVMPEIEPSDASARSVAPPGAVEEEPVPGPEVLPVLGAADTYTGPHSTKFQSIRTWIDATEAAGGDLSVSALIQAFADEGISADIARQAIIDYAAQTEDLRVRVK